MTCPKKGCQHYHHLISVMIRATHQQWLEWYELDAITDATEPCPRCILPKEATSEMTGRLYMPVYELYRKQTGQPAAAKIITMTPAATEATEC